MAKDIENLTPEKAIENMRNAGFTDEADSAMRSFESIKSSDLESEPDFKITPPAPITEAPALQGQIEASTDQFTRDLEQKTKNAEAMKDIGFQEYMASILGTEGEIESTAKAYSKKGGVDDVDKELVDINNQILQEQNALRRQIERVQTEAGLTKGQVNQRVGEIERVSLRKQADLTIIQMGIQGRYDSAKAIADRAVAVKMEQQKRVNDALKLQYEENKDLFTVAEQRLFESRLSDRERAFEKEEADEKAKYDLAIEAQKNGAPQSIISLMLSSDSKEGALATGGSYIGLMERQKLALQQEAAGRSARKDLFEMALLGDQQSITALGYDPRQYTEEAKEEKKKEESSYDSAMLALDKSGRALTNKLGLSAGVSSGAIPQFISTLGLGAKNITGIGVGDTDSGKNIIALRDEFLANVGLLIEKDTIDALGNLPVPLTPLTDEDVALVRRSATVLGGLAEIKDGKIIRINGSEVEVRRLIEEAQTGYKNIIDTLNRNGFSSTEVQEASDSYHNN